MPTLRIEHELSDYDTWKRAFDSDPLDRERSGVLAYRIQRGTGKTPFVAVDLEFDTVAAAEDFLTRLRAVWRSRPELTVDPQGWVVETVENHRY
ncbi:hypothetical protein ACWGB8_31790 [Kitasatospora sp. NPDC054939]